MTEPDWVEVLTIMYQSGGQVNYPPKGVEPDDNHILIKESDLNVFEVRSAVDDLRRADLIEEIKGTKLNKTEEVNDRIRLRLTSKGFEVGHERELKTKQHKMNQLLTGFTAILAGSAIIQAFVGFSTQFPWGISITFTIIFAAVLVGVVLKLDIS